MSSANFARLGNTSENHAPDWPCCLNSNGDPPIFGTPVMKAKRSPLYRLSGASMPSNFDRCGL